MKEQVHQNQLEMFSETGSVCGQHEQNHGIFSIGLKGHEKIVILIIVFILTAATSFTFGVEHGKKAASLKTKDMLLEIVNTAPQGAAAQEQKERLKNNGETQKKSILANLPLTAPVELNIRNKTEQTSEKTNRYTIQLASYKNNTTAKKEAQRLKNNGHAALIMPKGNYIILCVGNFNNKEIAKTKLSEFKKTYHDGMIRRL